VQKFLEKMCRKPWLFPLLSCETCSKAENPCLESRFLLQVGVMDFYLILSCYRVTVFCFVCVLAFIGQGQSKKFRIVFLLCRYSGKTQKQIVEFVRENYVKRQTFQR
jgi:hypothetical protein